MASLVRFVAVALTAAQLGCSSTEGGPGADVPEYVGAMPDPAAGSGGTAAAPLGVSPGDPALTSGGVGGIGAEGPPLNPPLTIGEVPGDVTDPAGVGGGSGGAEALPLPAAGAGGTGEIPVSPASALPVPATSGVPRPAGAVGNLRVLDWAGFQAAVSYTLDDADTSQVTNYDALQALGVPFTFYLWTSMGGAMSDVWSRAVADGHELGNHTQSHQMGTAANIGADTDTATRFIEGRFGVTVRTMAAPFGNTQYADVARTRFLINRGTGGGQIAPNDNTDRFNLPTFIPVENAPASAFNGRIDMARAAGRWETVLVHAFIPSGGFQAVALDQFVAAVNYAKSFDDVWIGTVLDVGAYWIAQSLLTDVTPATSGNTTTWQWTLPARFPPNQFVRVTVGGGTLSQAGAPLTWDEHGYYEVALDVGSLTLAP
jgi:peptidoglycan/xylan/chitin deacetylase (PgdA/CDA1 family)